MAARNSLPADALTKAIRDRFLASHNVDSIDVAAYDLNERSGWGWGGRTAASRSVCVVIHYPAIPPKEGHPFSERLAHCVVCRYHLKPDTDLAKASVIRGIITRVGNDISSEYRK